MQTKLPQATTVKLVCMMRGQMCLKWVVQAANDGEGIHAATSDNTPNIFRFSKTQVKTA